MQCNVLYPILYNFIATPVIIFALYKGKQNLGKGSNIEYGNIDFEKVFIKILTSTVI